MRIRQTWWALLWHPVRTFREIYHEASLRRGWLGYAFLLACIWGALVVSQWLLVGVAYWRGDLAFAKSLIPTLLYYAKSFLWVEGIGFSWLFVATIVYYLCLRCVGGVVSFRRFATAYAWVYSGTAWMAVLMGLLFWPVIIGFVLHNEGSSFLWVLGLSALYFLGSVFTGLWFSFLVGRLATEISAGRIVCAILGSVCVVTVLVPLSLRCWPYVKVAMSHW